MMSDSRVQFVICWNVIIVISTALFIDADSQRKNIEFPFHTGSRDIQCENKTVITIRNITVTGRNKTNPCILDTKDEESIKSDFDGQESCVIRTNWTSDCLWEYGYYTFTYTCRDSQRKNIEFPFHTGSRDIQCENKTVITIRNITVTGRNKTNPCILDTKDEESIKSDFDGQESCVIRTNWTSDCLWEYGYYTFTYTCRASNQYCDFENTTCSWSQNEEDNFDWVIREAGGDGFGTVPYTDHTTGSANGHLLYIGKSSSGYTTPLPSSKARISSVNITSPGVKCLTFWYQMHGTSLGVLNVYQQSGLELGLPIRTKTAQTGHAWYKETVNINGTSSYKIVFEGVQGGSDSSISIDDTAITDGTCTSSKFDCSFENETSKLCDWFKQSTDAISWIRTQPRYRSGIVPYYDHSLGWGYGHYLRLKVMARSTVKTARLNRIDYPLADKMCFTFWYYMFSLHDHEPNRGMLNITWNSGTDSTVLWTDSKTTNGRWSRASINMNANNDKTHTIVIEGIIDPGTSEYSISVDDVSMKIGSCSGDKQYEQSYNRIGDTIDIQDCTKQNLDTQSFGFNFLPNYNVCSNVYNEIETTVKTMCDNFSDADFCSLSFNDDIKKNKECFVQRKNVEINYVCVVAQIIPNEGSQSGQGDNIELISIVIGSVLGVFVVCLSVVLICLVRRKRIKTDKVKNNEKNSHENLINNVIQKAKTENDMSVQYNKSENEEHVYMNNISELNMDESYQNNAYLEESESETPNKNKDMDENKSQRNETDFTKTEELRTSHSDLYTESVEGVYDDTNNKQYRFKNDSEQPIYSHSVDNVYDSASQTMYRMRDDDVDTYDHFFGHQSESDYDVTHRY